MSDDEELDELLKSLFLPPERPHVRLFQHQILPVAVMLNHPELSRALGAQPETAAPLLHFWSQTLTHMEMAGAWSEEFLESDDCFELLEPLIAATQTFPYRAGGYTLWGVTMPEPLFPLESLFAAICRRDGESFEYGRIAPGTRYFTLEKAYGEGGFVLCEWRHVGHGDQRNEFNLMSGPPLEHCNYGEVASRSLDDFVARVFQQLDIDPAVVAEFFKSTTPG